MSCIPNLKNFLSSFVPMSILDGSRINAFQACNADNLNHLKRLFATPQREKSLALVSFRDKKVAICEDVEESQLRGIGSWNNNRLFRNVTLDDGTVCTVWNPELFKRRVMQVIGTAAFAAFAHYKTLAVLTALAKIAPFLKPVILPMLQFIGSAMAKGLILGLLAKAVAVIALGASVVSFITVSLAVVGGVCMLLSTLLGNLSELG